MPSLPVPPLSPYGTLKGFLFQYAAPSAMSLVAFESIHPEQQSNKALLPENKCILLGGLSDGLLSMPYTEVLEETCHLQPGKEKWSLVQPTLSSSYTGFGHGSLERDTRELGMLLRYLHVHRNAKRFCLVGHSTGCQEVVHFMKHCTVNGDDDMARLVGGIVLQGSVSDRELGEAEDGKSYKENLETARHLVEQNRGEEMMPRKSFWAPITASRFIALQDRLGADDFFSSDLADNELKDRLGHLGEHDCLKKVLVAYSGADQYVPKHVDKKLLVERLCNAINQEKNAVATPLLLQTGNHNLYDCPTDTSIFIEEIKKILLLIAKDQE